jgi:hypothetical protein
VDAVKRREAFIAGTLRGADGGLRVGDTVVVTWTRGPFRAEDRSVRIDHFTAITGTDGRWLACGLARGARITVDLVPEAGNETMPVEMNPALTFVVRHMQRKKNPSR